MKKLILVCALLMCGCVTVDSNYHTTKYRHYDNHGRYEGYTIETPYVYRHYDKSGKYMGRTTK